MTSFSDTFIYSLIITLFGIGIVFIVLVFLQYILKLMEVVFHKDKKKDKETVKAPEVKTTETAMTQANNPETGDDRLIAVITAAAISCLGRNSSIVVRKIRRINDTTPAWGMSSRTEQMANRL